MVATLNKAYCILLYCIGEEPITERGDTDLYTRS